CWPWLRLPVGGDLRHHDLDLGLALLQSNVLVVQLLLEVREVGLLLVELCRLTSQSLALRIGIGFVRCLRRVHLALRCLDRRLLAEKRSLETFKSRFPFTKFLFGRLLGARE